MHKSFWVKLNKNNFDSLIQDVNNNLNNNELKTTVNKKFYNLKNAQTFLVNITTKKISENEARDLYSNLITPDIHQLKNAKHKSKYKKNEILDILENLESVFTGAYLYYEDVPSELEETIAKRLESVKERFDEIKRKEQDINNESLKYYLSNYLSPSNMYENSIETKDAGINQIKINSIK